MDVCLTWKGAGNRNWGLVTGSCLLRKRGPVGREVPGEAVNLVSGGLQVGYLEERDRKQPESAPMVSWRPG